MTNKQKIEALEKGIKSSVTPENLKEKMRTQLTQLKALEKESTSDNKPKFKVGDVVANTKSKNIGTVLDVFESGDDLRTDADGVVSISNLEIYDKNKHSGFNIAPSIKEKLESKKPKKIKPSSATPIKKASKNYYRNKEIKSVTVLENGKKVTYAGKDVLNGANFFKEGGVLVSKATYVPVRNIVEVTFEDGSKDKPRNGYHIKNGATPIMEHGGEVLYLTKEQIKDKLKVVNKHNAALIYALTIFPKYKEENYKKAYEEKYDSDFYSNLVDEILNNNESKEYLIQIYDNINKPYSEISKYSDQKEAMKWWSSLSINEQKIIAKKYFQGLFYEDVFGSLRNHISAKSFAKIRKDFWLANGKPIINKYEKGGEIPNNYEGKTAKEVWDNWSKKQREHFLADHYDVIEPSDLGAKDSEYEDLDFLTQSQIELHISQGQYENGGPIELPEGSLQHFENYYLEKGGKVGRLPKYVMDFQENDYKKMVQDYPDYPFYSVKNGIIQEIFSEKTEDLVAKWNSKKKELTVYNPKYNSEVIVWLKDNSFLTLDQVYEIDEMFEEEEYKLGGALLSAWKRERKYVNKSEDYEVRYAKGKNRSGYKKYEDGGEVGDYAKVPVGYNMTHYGLIKKVITNDVLYPENGYEIAGIGDVLHPEQFEIISSAEFNKLKKQGTEVKPNNFLIIEEKFEKGGELKTYKSYKEFIDDNIGKKEEILLASNGYTSNISTSQTKESIDAAFKELIFHNFLDREFYSNYASNESKEAYKNLVNEYFILLKKSPKEFSYFWKNFIEKSGRTGYLYDLKNPDYSKNGKRIELDMGYYLKNNGKKRYFVESTFGEKTPHEAPKHYPNLIFIKFKENVPNKLKSEYESYLKEYAGEELKFEKGGVLSKGDEVYIFELRKNAKVISIKELNDFEDEIVVELADGTKKDLRSSEVMKSEKLKVNPPYDSSSGLTIEEWKEKHNIQNYGKGGQTAKGKGKGAIFAIAREIRKPGEKWQEAVARAGKLNK